MRRLIAAVLAFCAVVLLTSCNGGSQVANPSSTVNPSTSSKESISSIDELIVSTEWKAILDYSVSFYNRTFYFNQDGSGTMLSEDGNGRNISWSSNPNGIRVQYEYSTSSGTKVNSIDFEVQLANESTRLIDTDSLTILVPTDNYDSEFSNIKSERISISENLDWEMAKDLERNNGAKFEQEYSGRVFKWSAIVNEISKNSCRLSLKETSVNPMYVYMSKDDLVKLEKGKTITVIGIMGNSPYDLNNAFLIHND